MSISRGAWLALAALVLSVPVVVAASPAYAASGTGSISGQLSTNGQPRTDVYVTLYTYETGWVGSTSVDRTGVFRFSGLAPGDYQLNFNWGNGLEQWYRSRPPAGPGDLVTVVAGQETTIADETLPTGTIAGTLTDDAGNPMAYAEAMGESVEGGPYPYAFTDASGHYAIAALPGKYKISFRPQGYATDYVPQSPSLNNATVFTVAVGSTVTVDEKLPPTGSISGRFTTSTGAPVANAQVSVGTVDNFSAGYATTDADGNYTVPNLYVGGYTISFTDPVTYQTQYAYGKFQYADADVITVTKNATTVVNDSEPASGSVTVTARDSQTGRPIANFCASGDLQQACSAGTGTVTLTGLRQGSRTVDVYTEDQHYFGASNLPVTISPDVTASVAAKLRPGVTITTTVKDAVTGAPVASAAVVPTSDRSPTLPMAGAYNSDDQGTLRIGPLESGSYALFVWAPGDYGDQWVGQTHGVGTPAAARRITALAGMTVAAPPILLDRAGTVSGTITDAATGAPVAGALITNSPFDPGPGPVGRGATSDRSGRYTLKHLGPYQWPLFLIAPNHPEQWSGGVPEWTRAKLVKLSTDNTAEFNPALVGGITMSGAIRGADGTPAKVGRVIAYNVATGDRIGMVEVTDGTYRMPMLGRQSIKLRYESGNEGEPSGWYGGKDSAHAKVVPVRTSDLTLDLVIG